MNAQDRTVAIFEALRRRDPKDSGITVLSAVVDADGSGEILVSITAQLEAATKPCGKCNGTGRDFYPYTETYSDRDCYHCGGRTFGEGWGKGATMHAIPIERNGYMIDESKRKIGKNIKRIVSTALMHAAMDIAA